MGYSFYGGRQGESFKIVRNFTSVQEMTTNFLNGAAYKDVNYGEYVLINGDDVTNPQNGQLYKRGINGPEYVCNLAGNPGYSPHIIAADEFRNYTKPEDTLNLIQHTSVLNQENFSIVDGGEFSNNGFQFLELEIPIIISEVIHQAGVTTVSQKEFSDGQTSYHSYLRLISALNIDENKKYTGTCLINNVLVKIFIENRYTIWFENSYNDSSFEQLQNLELTHEYQGDLKTWDNFIDDIKVSTESTTTQSEGFIVTKEFEEYKVGDFIEKEKLNNEKEMLEAGFIKPINKAQVQIGLQIPRTVFNFESESVSPYQSSKTTENGITEKHLFAYDYKILVPKGVKGDSIIEIGELIKPKSEDCDQTESIVSWTTNLNKQEVIVSFSKVDYEKIDSLKDNSTFLFYKQEVYDKGQNELEDDEGLDTKDKVITTYHYIGPSPAGVSILSFAEKTSEEQDDGDQYKINLNGISFINREDAIERLVFPDNW